MGLELGSDDGFLARSARVHPDVAPGSSLELGKLQISGVVNRSIKGIERLANPEPDNQHRNVITLSGENELLVRLLRKNPKAAKLNRQTSIVGLDLMCGSNAPHLNEGYFWKDMVKLITEIFRGCMRYLCVCFRAALLVIFLCHQVSADVKPLPLSTSSVRGQYVELDKPARRGPRIAATATTAPFLQMPQWLFAAPGFRVQQRFTRIWQLSGSQFCQKLREKGIAISDWRPAAFGRSKVYECIFEASYPVSGDSGPQALFLIVPGSADGNISSVRLKISFGDAGSQMRLLPEVTNILNELLSMQNWFDREMIMREVKDIKELSKDEFGISISFLREKTNLNNFNLRILIKN